MTMICPEPAVLDAPPADPQLDAEMAAAARCADVLADSGLNVAFERAGAGTLAITLERPPGEPLRRLGAVELLALLELSADELRAWATRPELPIPRSAARW